MGFGRSPSRPSPTPSLLESSPVVETFAETASFGLDAVSWSRGQFGVSLEDGERAASHKQDGDKKSPAGILAGRVRKALSAVVPLFGADKRLNASPYYETIAPNSTISHGLHEQKHGTSMP